MTGKHLLQSVFFNKVVGLRPATLSKKRLWQRCFPVNFVKFLRTSFVKNSSKRLLLNTVSLEIEHSLTQFRTYLNCLNIFRKRFLIKRLYTKGKSNNCWENTWQNWKNYFNWRVLTTRFSEILSQKLSTTCSICIKWVSPIFREKKTKPHPSAIRPKLCKKCAFLQNFQPRNYLKFRYFTQCSPKTRYGIKSKFLKKRYLRSGWFGRYKLSALYALSAFICFYLHYLYYLIMHYICIISYALSTLNYLHVCSCK